MKTGFTGKRYFEWLGRESQGSTLFCCGVYNFSLWPEYAVKSFIRGKTKTLNILIRQYYDRNAQCQP